MSSRKKGSRKSSGSKAIEEEDVMPLNEVDEYMAKRYRSKKKGGDLEPPVNNNSRNIYVDLSSASDSSGDEDGYDDYNDDEDDEEMMEQRLRENLVMLSGDEDDQPRRKKGRAPAERWGSMKQAFYQHDEDEMSSSDERLHEEEALRLQAETFARMNDQDFDLPASVAATMQGTKKSKKEKKRKSKEAPEVEKIERSDKHSKKKKKKADKELLALLADLQAKTKEVQQTVRPILEKARRGEIQTSSGLSFLELKNLLLLNYCLNLNYYLLLKAEGKSVKDHPVIDELVRLRLLIEKTKPIDDKIRPQVSRLLKTAAVGVDAVRTDPSMMRANMAQMLPQRGGKAVAAQEEEDDGEDDNKLYRAPRAVAMYYEDEGTKAEKRERREKKVRERAAKSNIMKMVQQEFGEGPEEVGTGLNVMDYDEAVREEAREREQYELDHFVRLRPTKEQRKKEKREFVDELKSLDDFGDLEKALKDARQRNRKEGGEQPSQLDGPLAQMAQRLREAQQAEFPDLADEGDSRRVSKRDLEAEAAYEEFLEEAQKKREASKHKKKKKARYDDNPNARRQVAQVAESADGKRSITKQIEQNRGIGHQKKKDIARVKHKKKFAKAVKKRSTMTQKMRTQDKRYSGEASGVNVNVIRSTKLG